MGSGVCEPGLTGWPCPQIKPLPLITRRFSDQLSQQQGQIAEIGQAMSVAGRAADTAKDMLRQLDSAENWSTYDGLVQGRPDQPRRQI